MFLYCRTTSKIPLSLLTRARRAGHSHALGHCCHAKSPQPGRSQVPTLGLPRKQCAAMVPVKLHQLPPAQPMALPHRIAKIRQDSSDFAATFGFAACRSPAARLARRGSPGFAFPQLPAGTSPAPCCPTGRLHFPVKS